jgi:hypothetical protein
VTLRIKNCDDGDPSEKRMLRKLEYWKLLYSMYISIALPRSQTLAIPYLRENFVLLFRIFSLNPELFERIIS